MSNSPKTSSTTKFQPWRLGFSLALLLLLLGVMTAWFWDGSAPDDADLQVQRQPLPTESNHFDDIQQAVASLKLTDPEFFAVREEVQMENRHRKTMYLILDKNQAAMEQFHAAIRQGPLQVPPVKSSASDIDYLEAWSSLVRLSIVQARYLCYQDQYDEAFELLVDLCRFGHRVQDAGGSLFHALFGMYVQRLSSRALIRLAQRYPVPADLLQKSARNLTGYRRNRAGLEAACRVHYRIWTNDLKAIKARRYDGDYPGLDSLLKPYRDSRVGLRLNRTRRMYAKFWRGILANLQRPFPQATPIPPPDKPQMSTMLRLLSNPNYMGEHLFWALSRPFHELQERVLRNSTNVAVCQLFLALKAYHTEHGELPETLAALTPDYLAAIPKDAFDGATFRYKRDQRKLYSVGSDLQDSGGAEAPKTFTEFSFKKFWLPSDPTIWLPFSKPES